MTDEEKKFQELCAYVKSDIMKYDSNQKLSKNMILRLRGLKDGKYMANKNIPSLANYSYDIILLTFKYVKHHNLDYIKLYHFHGIDYFHLPKNYLHCFDNSKYLYKL